MADFDFYRNQYLGETVPEKAFPGLVAQAKGILDGYCRKYTASGDETSRNMALCAMAEVLWDQRRNRHSAASVGSARVQYAVTKEPLERRLYRAAAVYLDFYRGVG